MMSSSLPLSFRVRFFALLTGVLVDEEAEAEAEDEEDRAPVDRALVGVTALSLPLPRWGVVTPRRERVPALRDCFTGESRRERTERDGDWNLAGR
jgi:hypothetical protein